MWINNLSATYSQVLVCEHDYKYNQQPYITNRKLSQVYITDITDTGDFKLLIFPLVKLWICNLCGSNIKQDTYESNTYLDIYRYSKHVIS